MLIGVSSSVVIADYLKVSQYISNGENDCDGKRIKSVSITCSRDYNRCGPTVLCFDLNTNDSTIQDM